MAPPCGSVGWSSRTGASFRSASIKLQPRTFIVGPNAAGKSNLLDALRFLRELAEDGGGLQRAVVEQRQGLKSIRSLHARAMTQVSVAVQVEDEESSWRLGVINQALKAVLPKLRDITIKRDQQGTPHLNGNYAHWRAPGAHQSETQFSDGTLRLIGLLWTLSAAGGPILLEEPEISLHESAVVQLPVILHRVAQTSGRQIIVSTHSAALLNDRGIEPREIVLLETTDEDTQVRSGDEVPILGELAEADAPLGTTLIGMTAPDGVAQLSRVD